MFYTSLYVRQDIPGLESLDNYVLDSTFRSRIPGVARLQARLRQQDLKLEGKKSWMYLG